MTRNSIKIIFTLFLYLFAISSCSSISAPTIGPTPTMMLPTRAFTPASGVTDKELLANLMSDPGCVDNCFLSITPGRTTRQEVLDLLRQLQIEDAMGQQYADDSLYFYLVDLPTENSGETTYLSVRLYMKDDVVTALDTSQLSPSQYSLRGIFLAYGVPDQVFLSTFNNFVTEPFARLFLVYSDEKFAVSYFDHRDGEGPICFGEAGSLWTWNAKTTSFAEVLKNQFYLDLYDVPLIELERATGISKGDFYEAALASSIQCVTTPSELWPDQ